MNKPHETFCISARLNEIKLVLKRADTLSDNDLLHAWNLPYEAERIRGEIRSTLTDARLEDLMVTPEFKGARAKLWGMNKRIEEKGIKSIEDWEKLYLQNVRWQMRKIDVHYQMITVEGEERPVRFVTAPFEGGQEIE